MDVGAIMFKQTSRFVVETVPKNVNPTKNSVVEARQHEGC